MSYIPSAVQQKYSVLGKIGSGAYGDAYKAVNKTNLNEVVALKKVHLPSNDGEGIPQYTMREITILNKLNRISHVNVVKLFDVISDFTVKGDSITLVFEFVDQCVLQYIEFQPVILAPMAKSLVHQTLSGLDFLHVNGILHR